MTVDNEIEISCEKNPPDLNKIKNAWEDLINARVHADFLCLCPSCLYQTYREEGGRLDKEIFFLDWLYFEIKLSMVDQRITQSLEVGSKPKISVDMREFFNVPGSIKVLSEFIETNFPDINHDYKRIKLKLWRFKKSGVLKYLEQKKIKIWMKAHPVKRKDHPLIKLKLLQKIADFIYSQPEHKALEREIYRKFFQKKSVVDIEEELDEMNPWLQANYGIFRKQGKRKDQIIYYGVLKTSRGRFFRVGIPEPY